MRSINLSRLLLLTLGLTSVQTQAINLQTFQFTDSSRYSILDDTGSEHFLGRFVFYAGLNHSNQPVVFTTSDNSTYVGNVINSFDALRLGGSYRFQNIPMTLGIEIGLVQASLPDSNVSRVDDTKLKMKYRLWESKSLESAFSINPEIILPTGSKDDFVGVGSLSAKLRGVFETKLSKFNLLASLGYGHSEKNEYLVIDYKKQILTALGLSVDLSKPWSAAFETFRDITINGNTRQDNGVYLLTMKHKTFTDGATYFGAGLGGLGEWEKKNWNLFAGIKMAFGEDEKKSQPMKEIAPAPLVADEKDLGVPELTENIYYANAEYVAESEELHKVAALVEKAKINKYKLAGVFVEGFASKVGEEEANHILSEKRAELIRKELVKLGVHNNLIRTVAYGDKVSKNFKDSSKDRKVQIRIYLKK